MKNIFIIDNNEIMCDCVARALEKYQTQIFHNIIDAMNLISDGGLPDLIFLDIMLDGPDGFSFLNELASYPDTSKIPIVIITSLDLPDNLAHYGIQKVFKKETMTPKDIQNYARKFLGE